MRNIALIYDDGKFGNLPHVQAALTDAGYTVKTFERASELKQYIDDNPGATTQTIIASARMKRADLPEDKENDPTPRRENGYELAKDIAGKGIPFTMYASGDSYQGMFSEATRQLNPVDNTLQVTPSKEEKIKHCNESATFYVFQHDEFNASAFMDKINGAINNIDGPAQSTVQQIDSTQEVASSPTQVADGKRKGQ